MRILNYAKNIETKRNKVLELFCVYFMKFDIFENFIGKILYSIKQSLSQIKYNEIKL